MEYKEVQKEDFTGKKVKVLDTTYEPGNPATLGGWHFFAHR